MQQQTPRTSPLGMSRSRCAVCGHLDDRKYSPHNHTKTTVWLSPLGPLRMMNQYVGYHEFTLEHQPSRRTCWCTICTKQRRIEIAEHYLLLPDDEIEIEDKEAHRREWAARLEKARVEAAM